MSTLVYAVIVHTDADSKPLDVDGLCQAVQAATNTQDCTVAELRGPRAHQLAQLAAGSSPVVSGGTREEPTHRG